MNDLRLVSIFIFAVLVSLVMAACHRSAPAPALIAPSFSAGLAFYKKGEFAKALEQWRPLANQGDANAQFYLGGMYAHGEGVAKDEVQAFALYRKVAEQGDVAAECMVGLMYKHGHGVAVDRAQAIAWYRKAADQGYADANRYLADMYSNGQGLFAVYVRAGNKIELSDEPTAACVPSDKETLWKVARWTGRWTGRAKACWYKGRIKDPYGIGVTVDAITVCVPKGSGGPYCQYISPEYFTAIDSLPRAAF